MEHFFREFRLAPGPPPVETESREKRLARKIERLRGSNADYPWFDPHAKSTVEPAHSQRESRERAIERRRKGRKEYPFFYR
jgi:hypothetical protein